MNLNQVFEHAGFDLHLQNGRYYVSTNLSATNVACRVGGVANVYNLLAEAVEVFDKVEIEAVRARGMGLDRKIFLNWYEKPTDKQQPPVKTRG